MFDTIKIAIVCILTGAIFLMAGCGGGGGGGAVSATKVSGTASKGLIYPGNVSIFAVDAAGAKSVTPISVVATDVNGQFNANLWGYKGALLIEVTGDYTDEAKGSKVVIGPGRPMRAVIDLVGPGSTRRIAVTPLTDLAYSLAGTLTAANITAANARVSSLFKLSDITGIEPVEPTAVSMGSANLGKQSYTLALATLSQMAKSSNPLAAADFSQIAAILDAFRSDLNASANAGLGSLNKNAFSAALGVVASGSLSGFPDATNALASVGTNSLKLTLATSGVPNGTLIGGIQGAITFPDGTNMRLDPNNSGSVLPGLFLLTNSASASMAFNTFSTPVFSFGIINAGGFSGGDFATLLVDVSSGAPVAGSFSLDGLSLLDINGNTINGATVLIK